ncbi:uncharacterized protein K452DRAFT_292716 [Aplosporella prunicola CBS 121167]|uniref:Uncharacterized protein n=1 Tax=Aplosporella prunicola CBS 121167 TaxID=1176127 RepID=A0A6A6AY21_9PEZI|nr:uncharacterized protein K452DRAFT_292716 [Aplosporella prunicola CBS 121167]KAF2136063.1 hypothetical protein K452DRAFT_292716 [Aplosporella prunicola CBS 121167]
MAATKIHVSIAVFKGDPVDYQIFRHTMLWFRFADQLPPVSIDVMGPPQEFQFQVRENYDPSQSRDFAKEVSVGYLRVAMTKPQLVNLISQTPLENSNPEFNCQVWVEAALKRLQAQNYISEDEYRAGVDGMVDAIMEARDEP